MDTTSTAGGDAGHEKGKTPSSKGKSVARGKGTSKKSTQNNKSTRCIDEPKPSVVRSEKMGKGGPGYRQSNLLKKGSANLKSNGA